MKKSKRRLPLPIGRPPKENGCKHDYGSWYSKPPYAGDYIRHCKKCGNADEKEVMDHEW